MKMEDGAEAEEHTYNTTDNSTKKELKSTISTPKWRRGRDSSLREIAHKLISNQPRYDRFDTSSFIYPYG